MISMRTVTRFLGGGIVVAVAAGCATGGANHTASPDRGMVQTGYGSVKSEDVTGSVSSLNAEELGRMRYAHMAEMLEGRVPGLVVTRQAGGGFSLRIRGTSSLTGNNEPLIVIDGMPLNPFGGSRALASISPRDVERIDVLKGSETTLYGSRGANGVIVITTIRP
jgi:TonB-dependent starch-binding outer membrane protein SusC